MARLPSSGTAWSLGHLRIMLHYTQPLERALGTEAMTLSPLGRDKCGSWLEGLFAFHFREKAKANEVYREGPGEVKQNHLVIG